MKTNLTDKERMDDLLTQEKYLVGAYGTFLPEAACKNLRGVLTQNMTECAENQFEVFEQMKTRGWYQVKNAPEQEIDSARQKYAQMKGQLA